RHATPFYCARRSASECRDSTQVTQQEALVFQQINPTDPTRGWDRRTFLKASGITIGGVSLAALAAACGAGGGAGGGSAGGDTLTLKMPFLADMQIPDPDIMYEGE